MNIDFNAIMSVAIPAAQLVGKAIDAIVQSTGLSQEQKDAHLAALHEALALDNAAVQGAVVREPRQ